MATEAAVGLSARWWRRRLDQLLVGNFTGIGACLRKLISLDQKPDFGVAFNRLADFAKSSGLPAHEQAPPIAPALIAETAAMLPENFRNEREATIQQFVTDVQVVDQALTWMKEGMWPRASREPPKSP